MKILEKSAGSAGFAGAMCILLVVAIPKIALSSIYACPSNDTVVYQDRPCPEEKSQAVEKKVSSRYPMNIHESWFDIPEQARERAFCDRRGCECGNLEKRHKGSLLQAVADALYLDGSWHRYDVGVEHWLDATTMTSEYFTAEDEMLEASCQIMMSQVLLLTYFDDVLTILQRRVNTAKERGFDTELPCHDGVAEACEHYGYVQLQARIQTDAAALQRVRGEDPEPTSKPALSAALPVLDEMEAARYLEQDRVPDAQDDLRSRFGTAPRTDPEVIVDAGDAMETGRGDGQLSPRVPESGPQVNNSFRLRYTLNPGADLSPRRHATQVITLNPEMGPGHIDNLGLGWAKSLEGRLGLGGSALIRPDWGFVGGKGFNRGPRTSLSLPQSNENRP